MISSLPVQLGVGGMRSASLPLTPINMNYENDVSHTATSFVV